MEANFDRHKNVLTVSLSKPDILGLINGTSPAPEIVRRHLGNLSVNVLPGQDKQFDPTLPVGHQSHIDRLNNYQTPRVNVDGSEVTIRIPRAILASNISAAERIPADEIIRENGNVRGKHLFTGDVLVRLEDAAEVDATSQHDEAVSPDEL